MRDTSPHPLQLSEPLPLSRHPAMVYLHHLAPGSRPTMRQSLDTIAALLTHGECDALTLDWKQLRYEHTSVVQNALLERFEPTTVCKMLSALKRVLEEARKLGLISVRDYSDAVELPKIQASSKLQGRALSQEEIRALMKTCDRDESVLGIRDAALIAILRGAGLRRAEAVKLRLKDFEESTGALDVVCSKGRKYRRVYLPEVAIARVNVWLEVRGDEPGPLLCPVRKGGHIQYNHMTPQAVLWILQKRAKQAGLQPFSPHDFRRTFCSDLLDAGVDIVTVQKLAGHSSPTMTARYDRRGEETKRKAVQVLDL
ncbi:Phage integrase [Geitlerinema sp. FC II]|nr:Phage integrase [Geitlerinema sp. FC II]